ncbi:hypothetical protein CYY_003503 [Polysphondylium violaceum]|uniref:WD40 repeat-containing protein n=1 Tax=Polysphondylium violaceum TaxID=133409 RepID=A0A8J4PUM7_9MYCE|nr:hypothetical protein CYY_003503 [Polysphondylium violaceum]
MNDSDIEYSNSVNNTSMEQEQQDHVLVEPSPLLNFYFDNNKLDVVDDSPFRLVNLKATEFNTNSQIPNLHILPWKLNLMEVSLNNRLLFIGESHRLAVFDLDDIITPIYTVDLQNNGMTINQIRLGVLGGEEVLITVDEGGYIRILFVNDLDREYLRFYNAGISTWGIAMCPSKPLFAVSSNDFKINIWNLENEDPHASRRQLLEHKHNIPCIDFSPCGNFLVSVSIDKYVRVWDVETHTMLSSVVLSQWAWGCRFVDLTPNLDQIGESYLKKDNTHTIQWKGLSREDEFEEVEEANNVQIDNDQDDDSDSELDLDDNDLDDHDNNGGDQAMLDENHHYINDDDDDDDDEDLDEYQDHNDAQKEGLDPQQQKIDSDNSDTNNDDDDEEIEYNKSIIERHRAMIEKVLNLEGTRFKLINDGLTAEKKKNLTLPSNLVFSTYQNLYFSPQMMEDLNIVHNAIPTTFPIVQTQIDRIALLEVVPELSLVIAASQGPARCVSLYRIKRLPNTNKYNLVLDQVLEPPEGGPGLIIGLSVVKNYSPIPSKFSVSLYILYINGTFISYNIERLSLDELNHLPPSEIPNSKKMIFGLDISK